MSVYYYHIGDVCKKDISHEFISQNFTHGSGKHHRYAFYSPNPWYIIGSPCVTPSIIQY